MANSLSELRKLAVKHILRKGPADYLLRHALCKRWVESTHLDEMAWTDFKSLFFNFPKLNAALDLHDTQQGVVGMPLEPGERVTAFLAAASHEILHVLWLHRYRAEGKRQKAWKIACEYAINHELELIFGKEWIAHLGVMWLPSDIHVALKAEGLHPTTDNIYNKLVNDEKEEDLPDVSNCDFCDRCAEGEPTDPSEVIRVLSQLPPDCAEREDIVRYITAQTTVEQKIPWEMLLLGGIENAVNQEQSWSKPSRRNDLLPGWQHEKLLNFVWVLDVSPSIDDEMKQSFMSTLQAGINLYHDAQHRVIFFADGIEDDFVVSSGTNLMGMEVPEGNGTELGPVWEILERDMPEYALVLTDLELSAVPKPTYTKIIWGIVGNHRYFDPDYGIKIVLK